MLKSVQGNTRNTLSPKRKVFFFNIRLSVNMVTESVIDVADLSVNFKEKSTNYVEDYIVIEKAQMFKIMHSPLFLIRGLSVRDGEWVKRKPFCYANRISRCTILSLSLSLSFGPALSLTGDCN